LLPGKLVEEMINWFGGEAEEEESNNPKDSICIGAAGCDGYWIFEGGNIELIIILEGDI
jgi:hypothetical protein